MTVFREKRGRPGMPIGHRILTYLRCAHGTWNSDLPDAGWL